METAQILIKINQTKQSGGRSFTTNIQTVAPTVPFDQILAIYKDLTQSSETGEQAKELSDKGPAGEISGHQLDETENHLEDDQQLNSVLTVGAYDYPQAQPLVIPEQISKSDGIMPPPIPDEMATGKLSGFSDNYHQSLTLDPLSSQEMEQSGQLLLSKDSKSGAPHGTVNSKMEALELNFQLPLEDNQNTSPTKFDKDLAPFSEESIIEPSIKINQILDRSEAASKNPVPIEIDSIHELTKYISEWLGSNGESSNRSVKGTRAELLVNGQPFGQMELEITSFQGRVSLRVAADTTFANEEFVNQLLRLEESLQQSGIKLQNIEMASQVSSSQYPRQTSQTVNQHRNHLVDVQMTLSDFAQNSSKGDAAVQTACAETKGDVTELNEMANLVTQHSKIVGGATESKSESPRPLLSIPEFVQEVSDWISRNVGMIHRQDGTKQIKFFLTPEHLGQIEVNISTQDGQVSAQILTDTSQAKEILDNQLSQLRQTLQHQGLNLQKLEVVQQMPGVIDSAQTNQTTSQGGFHSPQEQRSASSARSGSKRHKESEPSEIEMESTLITYSGAGLRTASNIDFTA